MWSAIRITDGSANTKDSLSGGVQVAKGGIPPDPGWTVDLEFKEKSWGIEGARQWNHPVWETLVMLFHKPPLSSGGDFCKHHRVPREWTEACEWWEYHPSYTRYLPLRERKFISMKKNRLFGSLSFDLRGLSSSQNWFNIFCDLKNETTLKENWIIAISFCEDTVEQYKIQIYVQTGDIIVSLNHCEIRQHNQKYSCS